jgi:hypothetical protein
VLNQEVKDIKDSEDHVSATDLLAALTKVYGEIMSIVYYPIVDKKRRWQLLMTSRSS